MTTPNDVAGGREWNPYELATPVARVAVAQAPAPLARTPPAGAFIPRAMPAARDEAGPVLASLGSRLAAAAIDTALWCVPLLFVMGAVLQAYHLASIGLPLTTGGIGSKMFFAMLLWGALAIWNIVWLVQRGQSVGKRFIGIRIVRPDGSPAGAMRLLVLRGGAMSLLHWIAMQVHPLAALSFWTINVAMILGEERRCLHDRIADTIVVDA